MSDPEARLSNITTLLTDRGFATPERTSGSSSGGPFVTATFRRGLLKIGLIVRDGDKLGCPNYSYGAGYAGHEDVVEALGRLGEEQLVPGEFLAYQARDGGDAFEALQSDFTRIILPALEESEDKFRSTVDRALRLLRERRGW